MEGVHMIHASPNTFASEKQMKSFLSTETTSLRAELGVFFFSSWGLNFHHEYLKEIYPVLPPNHFQ